MNITIPLIRTLMPNVIASQLTGVQPMYVPSGKIFSMYSDYGESEFNKKYRFSRAKWYYCHFSLNDGESVLEWCTASFGKRPKNADAWTRWWFYGVNQIRFRDEADAIMFKLRFK